NTNFAPQAGGNAESALGWHYGGKGTEKQRIPGSDYIFGRTLSTACIVDDIVYIPELGGILHALDANTGERLWYHDLRAPIWSSPYYVDGKIFLGTDDTFLYIYEHDPKRRGEVRQADNDVEMFSRLRATPVVADGILYVMSETALYAIKQK
ncbi:MAG: PQQ-binding-like beta-propeller repeat protein, partial [Gemmataceae bacterium]